MDEREGGAAVVDAVFGMFVALFLVLGTIQVALTLYGRNVLVAAAHDGSRAAVEIGGTPADANVVARRAIERSAGDLVDDLRVDVGTRQVADRYFVTVVAKGVLTAPGPIPVGIPVVVRSSTSREVLYLDG